ncbi:MAG: hypothetical protein ACREDF_11100 [Thermoplasmata archaeon]
MNIKAKPEYARAFSTAFVADIERSPSLRSALSEGKLDGRGLAAIAFRSLSGKGPDLFPNLRRIVKETAKLEVAPSGMGQWAELAGALVSTAANVAAKTYTAKLEAQTATSIAKLQTQQQQAAAAAAELQAKAAALQYSNAEAAVRRAEAVSGGPTPSVLGVPWWGVALGVVGIGGVGYLLLRSKRRR